MEACTPSTDAGAYIICATTKSAPWLLAYWREKAGHWNLCPSPLSPQKDTQHTHIYIYIYVYLESDSSEETRKQSGSREKTSHITSLLSNGKGSYIKE
jgi:hypothetical protein